MIVEALARATPVAENHFVALDAGCGTGLCGPLIAPYVRHLTGVDLSSAMLAKSQGRGIYNRLVKAELTAFLRNNRDAFDVIVSADTLVYFGRIEEVLEAAFHALRSDGLLIFTVEALLGEETGVGYRLNPHGRYSHGRGYVREVLSTAGFTALSIEPSVLRTEGGSPVDGFVVTARRDAHKERGGAVRVTVASARRRMDNDVTAPMRAARG